MCLEVSLAHVLKRLCIKPMQIRGVVQGEVRTMSVGIAKVQVTRRGDAGNLFAKMGHLWTSINRHWSCHPSLYSQFPMNWPIAAKVFGRSRYLTNMIHCWWTTNNLSNDKQRFNHATGDHLANGSRIHKWFSAGMRLQSATLCNHMKAKQLASNGRTAALFLLKLARVEPSDNGTVKARRH